MVSDQLNTPETALTGKDRQFPGLVSLLQLQGWCRVSWCPKGKKGVGDRKTTELASFLKMESKPAILLPLVSIREPCGSHVMTSRVCLGSGSSWRTFSRLSDWRSPNSFCRHRKVGQGFKDTEKEGWEVSGNSTEPGVKKTVNPPCLNSKEQRAIKGKGRALARTKSLGQAAHARSGERARSSCPPSLALATSTHPQLLHQVHVGTLVFLHAALRDAGHVRSQGPIDEHAQHVQHSGKELIVGLHV